MSIFLNNRFILVCILINALIIFISGFEWNESATLALYSFDHIFTVIFILELIFKTSAVGFKRYWKSHWNKLDLILVLLAIPELISFLLHKSIQQDLSFLLVFRVTRVFKSFRFLKFIPGISGLIRGVQRALKASVIVFLGFSVYIFIIGMLSFYMFKNSAPQYFDNPISSLYSIFKIFTIEGWFEIPEMVTVGYSPVASFFTYLYFIFILMTGGIFGLSIVNSIFVDAMVSDNNDALEAKVDALNQKIDLLIAQKEMTIEEKLPADLN